MHMNNSLYFIYRVSKFCGLLPVTFLRSGGYEKPVLCKKSLFYSCVLFIAISVVQSYFVIHLLRERIHTNSDVSHVNIQIILSLNACIMTTYVLSAITRLIRMHNFFKISYKLRSVGSLINYHESTNSYNTVIAVHSILIIAYLGRSVMGWIRINCVLSLLPFFVSHVMCQIITSFADIQFTYFVFIVRTYFMLLNSRVNEVTASLQTVKSKECISFNRNNTSEFSAENSLVNCDFHELITIHDALCDVLDVINSTYSFQVLAMVGWKFLNVTIGFYLMLSVILDSKIYQVLSFPSLMFSISCEAMQLAVVVLCCNSTSFQVGTLRLLQN